MPTYIARISRGKDSLKMLDVILTRDLPLDRITTTEVWATDIIPAWLPPVTEFNDRVDEYIWKKYHIEVERLCARNKDGTKKTYEQGFYHVPKRRTEDKTFGKSGGGCSITGFPVHGRPWCQGFLKRRQIYEYTGYDQGLSRDGRRELVPEIETRQGFSPKPDATGVDTNIVEYIGIAADEPKRFGQLNERKRAPLVEFGIDEDLCGLHCMYECILSPSYDIGYRDGCWFCHNQGVNQLRHRKNYPDYWGLLLKWDKDSPVTFKADGHTVHDFDRRFALEDEGLIRPTDKWRWDYLEDRPIQLRMEV